MLRSTQVRIYVVVALVLLVYGGNCLARFAIEPPEVEMPTWNFDAMPTQLGEWTGMKPEKLDEKLASAADAKIFYNRAYRDKTEHTILVHTAVCDNPTFGICHNPQICYLYNGWNNKIRMFEKLSFNVGDVEKTIPVYVGLWEKEDKSEKVWIVYWYQLGPHVVFDRWDIGFKVRWALAGQKKWPPLIKVMLQIQASDSEDTKSRVLELAALVAQWENLPEHKLGL